MELRDIEYFAVVAEHGNIGRAAEALGLGQPALSKSLRRLETSVRTKLFIRTPKGVELTSEGMTLLSRVGQLRLSLADVVREIADVGEGRLGHLRIGIGGGFPEHLLALSCTAFLTDAPRATLDVTIATANELVPALCEGQLDFIVTGIPTPGREALVQEYLCEEVFAVYASTRHRLAQKKRVTLEDLVPERWAIPSHANVLSWNLLMRAFEDRGLPSPQIAMTTTSTIIRQNAVASSNLIGFGSRRAWQSPAPHLKLAEIRVEDTKWHRRLGLSYRKGAYLSPAAQRLIDTVKRTAYKFKA